MGRFSIDVKLYATAYVTADSEQEARALVSRCCGSEEHPEALQLGRRDLWIADEVVISPAVTSYGPDNGYVVEGAGA